MSRRVLNISRAGDSTTSLGSLGQGSVTLRGKKFFLGFRRKQVGNLFSVYTWTRRGHGGSVVARSAVAGCPPRAEGEGAAGGLRPALCPRQPGVPRASGVPFLPKVATLFSGSKPAFPQFACEAASDARPLPVSQGGVFVLKLIRGLQVC